MLFDAVQTIMHGLTIYFYLTSFKSTEPCRTFVSKGGRLQLKQRDGPSFIMQKISINSGQAIAEVQGWTKEDFMFALWLLLNKN